MQIASSTCFLLAGTTSKLAAIINRFAVCKDYVPCLLRAPYSVLALDRLVKSVSLSGRDLRAASRLLEQRAYFHATPSLCKRRKKLLNRLYDPKPLPGFSKMRCYVQFVTTPTADTPGTLLMLHFDDKRYLIGQVGEGTQRACTSRGIGLRKVSDILLTGRTEWKNLGGMMGLVLHLADIKGAAQDSAAAQATEKKPGDDESMVVHQSQAESGAKVNGVLNFYGPPNLNHIFATARRFIFRTGMPVKIKEFSAKTSKVHDNDIDVTWQDKNIRVWSMPVLPTQAAGAAKRPVGENRKRSYDEISKDEQSVEQEKSNSTKCSRDSDPESDAEYLRLRENIVSKMFGSNWRYDALIPQPLSQVKMPATVYLRDPVTNQTIPYTGPMPGGNDPVPNITVLVREPWPGALTEELPPTTPAKEAISYIIRNHPQRGKFMPEKARELEVMPVSKWNELSSGRTVQNIHGKDITPDMVLQPGTPGGGFAVVDLPDVSYVDNLLSRPEWNSAKVMEGVGAVVWILGNGVADHPSIRKFQADTPHLSHIVSASDRCSDVLSIESAVNSALRNHQVDQEIFPKLFVDAAVSQNGQITDAAALFAQRGLTIGLEPKLEVEFDKIVPVIDVVETEQKLIQDINPIIQKDLGVGDQTSEGEELQWSDAVPYGDVEIITLGTGSSHPSTHRNVSGTLVRVPGCGSYLLDAGEGTLGTLRRLFSPIELNLVLKDLKMIWISHLHADHHLGTASIIKAWYLAVHKGVPIADGLDLYAAHTDGDRLAVVSDAPMLHWLKEYSDAEDFGYSRILPMATRPARFYDHQQTTKTSLRLNTASSMADPEEAAITASLIRSMQLQSLETVFVNHCKGAQAISITTKTGFKISYSGDARPSADFAVIGKGSHVLVHEATFEDEMRMEAMAKKHSTAGEALVVAHQMQAKVCLLTHFSQRYPTMPSIGGGNPSPGSLRGKGSPVTSASQGVGIISLNSRELASEYKALIENGEISNMDLRHITAFDYMRIKLKDVPRLQRKQPLLKEICDVLATKIVSEVPEENEAAAEKTTPSKSQSKKEKKKKQAKQDKGKSSA